MGCGGDDESSGKGGGGSSGAAGVDGGAGAAGMAGEAGAGGTAGTAGMAGSAGAPEGDWFDVYREARDAVRASDDHLIARADDVVQAGDAEAAYEFVRDRIQTLPPTDVGAFNPSHQATHYGVRGTLRAGAGSPRDKAELLKSLYEKMGFAADIRAGFLVPEKRDAALLFGRSVRPPFEIADADAKIASWSQMVGVMPPATPFQIVDQDGSQAAALGAKIAALVSPPAAPESVDDILDERFPVVRVTVGGTMQLANPAVPDGVFGESYLESTVLSGGTPRTQDVTVRLWAKKAFGPNRNDPIVLVERTWTRDELVGRRVNVTARPPLPFVQVLPATVGELTTFIPSLSIEGTDLSPTDGEPLAEIGDAFTLAGDRLTWDATGQVTMNGLVLVDPGNPNAVAQVDSIDVLTVNGNTFPKVRARFAALDSGGQYVDGLTAADVFAEEEGQRIGGLLRKLPTERRVLFLFDGSGSLPPEFLGDNLKQLATDIATDILVDPNTVMAVGAIDAPNRHPWVSTVGEIQTQLDDTIAVASNVWGGLTQGVLREPDVLILVSDFAATDTQTPERTNVLSQSNTLLVALGAGADTTEELDTMNTMVGILGGSAGQVADHPAAIAQVTSTLPPVKANYELSYTAPDMGPTNRTVAVKLESAAPTDSGTYEAQALGIAPPELVGLHLTVEVDRREVTRTLAGLPPSADVDTATAADALAVHAALFGTTSLAFEGGAPPLSVVADDILTARLGFEGVWDARDDLTIYAEAFEAGVPSFPAMARALVTPLSAPDASAVTFPKGLRVIAHSRLPVFDAPMKERVDIMPFGQYLTVGEAPPAAWRTTLDRTATLAVLEDALWDESTVSELGAAEFEAVPAEDIDTRFAMLPNADAWVQAAAAFGNDTTLVVPKSGSPVAFFAVHEPTGSMIAVLDDGAGAGRSEDLERRLREQIRALEALNNLMGLAGISGGFWVELELAKAKVVARATLAIANLEGWGVEDSPDWTAEGAGESAVCNMVRDATFSGLGGGFGVTIGNLNRVLWFGLGGRDAICD